MCGWGGGGVSPSKRIYSKDGISAHQQKENVTITKADLGVHVSLRCQYVFPAEHRNHIGVVVGYEHRPFRVVIVGAEVHGANLFHQEHVQVALFSGFHNTHQYSPNWYKLEHEQYVVAYHIHTSFRLIAFRLLLQVFSTTCQW